MQFLILESTLGLRQINLVITTSFCDHNTVFEVSISYLFMAPLQKQKVSNSYPPEFGLVKRFWKYILDRQVLCLFLSSYVVFSKRTFPHKFNFHLQGVSGDDLWSSVPNNTLTSVASLLKHCDFRVTGKVKFCKLQVFFCLFKFLHFFFGFFLSIVEISISWE